MRKLVLSVSRNPLVRRVRDAVLAQAGGFAVAPALSIESALQKVDTLPFSAVILGASLSLKEKRRFLAAVRGKKHYQVISIHRHGDGESGADAELESSEPYTLIRIIEELTSHTEKSPADLQPGCRV
jgi:hypothetical protein